jgi:hypothetical protein
MEISTVIWGLRHYSGHLYRRHFIVTTDHAALTFLHKLVGKNAGLLRWSLRLAEYDFTVQYRNGAKTPHVDSLSRHICALASNPGVSKDKFGREQAKDAFCQAVKIGDPGGNPSSSRTKTESSTSGVKMANHCW